MTHLLDSPVPEEVVEELSSGQVVEEVSGEATAKVELIPEYAHRMEEAVKTTAVSVIGALFDAMILFNMDLELANQVMNKALELLKVRKVCDLTKT